ncbi:MAG: hypothetical protein QG608_1970 [Actinomycetota bacterium]|nr:hypothetical protein [Actinomycetota bacterium]
MPERHPPTKRTNPLPLVTDGPALARYLRRRGVSCRGVAAPGSLTTWGAIYVDQLRDIVRVGVVLEDHAQITALAESSDRVEQGWPVWFQVTPDLLPLIDTPRIGTPMVGTPWRGVRELHL